MSARLLRAEVRGCPPLSLRATAGSFLPELNPADGRAGADAVQCDVTCQGDRERLVLATLARHGRIDGLVNNAGTGATAPALRTSADTFARVVELNLVAPYALSCLVAEQMRANGGGAIV